MRIVVLGGGGDMGGHAVRDLLTHSTAQVTIADRRVEAAQQYVHESRGRLDTALVDATDEEALVEVLAGADAAVGCIGPFFEFAARLVRAAIRAGTPYVDICDDWGPVREIRGMDGWARAAGVPVITGLGWTPGITNLMAKRGAQRLDEVDEVKVAWAGSAADSAGFAVLMHVAYAITGEVPTFRDGETITVPARSGVEPVEFPEPLGRVWVSHCGHPEPLTLPAALEARTVSLKGGLTPQWNNRLAGALSDIGLFANPIRMRRVAGVIHQLEGLLRFGGVPFSGARVDVNGRKDGRSVVHSYATVDKMGRLTGIPAAIGALRLAERQVTAPGIHAPEDVIEPESFFAELRDRAVEVVEL